MDRETLKQTITKILEKFDVIYRSTHPKDDPIIFTSKVEAGVISIVKAPFIPVKVKVTIEKSAAKAITEGTAKTAGKAITEGTAKTAGKAITEGTAKTAGKAITEGTVKTGGKAVTKCGGKGAVKCGVKIVPIVSVAFGVGFGIYRTCSAVYHYTQGHIARGTEELGKATLEVTSGVAGCFPGLGTGLSVGIDASLAAWDFIDVAVDACSDKPVKPDDPVCVIVRAYINKIRDGIQNAGDEHQAKNQFQDCLLSLIFERFGATNQETKAAVHASYLNCLIELICKDPFFQGMEIFSTKMMVEKMKEKGFSNIQCQMFEAARQNTEP